MTKPARSAASASPATYSSDRGCNGAFRGSGRLNGLVGANKRGTRDPVIAVGRSSAVGPVAPTTGSAVAECIKRPQLVTTSAEASLNPCGRRERTVGKRTRESYARRTTAPGEKDDVFGAARPS
jgi:hypothetical protein